MILEDIVKSTKKRVEKSYANKSLEEIKEQAVQIHAKHEKASFRFEKALKQKPIAFICEVKKASPSKGVIAENFDYVKIAEEYEAAGATCISVLTEPDYFQGKNEYLSEISRHVSIPLLRKDFVIDEYQIYEAKVIGADAVLLICAILSEEQIRKFINIADSLGLSAIVETHDEAEINQALLSGARIIGVNNRNLKDFTVDIHNSLRLRKMVDKNILFISESGIKTAEDVKKLTDNDVNAVLIGETLMKSSDKAGMIRMLKGE